jgi:Ca2+-binding RTX toxin-like protein
MKKAFFLLLAVLAFIGAKANDGVYYASGNQLIPINETDISVKKEVLTITRVGDHVEVTVYYEFFNPGKPKDLLVGFEAPAPYPAY